MFDDACAIFSSVLHGDVRRNILAEFSRTNDFGKAKEKLRVGMESNTFDSTKGPIKLSHIVKQLDHRTKDDGFNVLNDWNGETDKLNDTTIPIDLLDFMFEQTVEKSKEAVVLAVLLDYYFFYMLALLSMRVWDGGSVGNNLYRLAALLGELQGSNGSGQKFVEDAETLVLVATSHFEADEEAYKGLLVKVQTLNADCRTRIALAHVPVLSSHLRFGFEATYGRDVLTMRKDNAPDYPWLCFGLATLMNAFDQGVEGVQRDKVLEALLNGLSPDTRAFVGKPPEFMSGLSALSSFRVQFNEHKDDLLTLFLNYQPNDDKFSPLSLYFNFAHNVLKAIVVDAMLMGSVTTLSLNALLSAYPDTNSELMTREQLAKRLMDYARLSPDRIRGRPVPVIFYESRKGRRAFIDTLNRID